MSPFASPGSLLVDLHYGADLVVQRLPVNELSRGDVLEGDSYRLVQSNLLRAYPSRCCAGQDLADFSCNVIFRDCTFPDRQQDISTLRLDGLTGVHH